MENQHRSVPCFVSIVYANTFYLCCGVSFMTLAAVSYERLVSVRLQSRYNDVFSSKRVLKYMVTIWIVNIILTSLGGNKSSIKRHASDRLVYLPSCCGRRKHWNRFDFGVIAECNPSTNSYAKRSVGGEKQS